VLSKSFRIDAPMNLKECCRVRSHDHLFESRNLMPDSLSFAEESVEDELSIDELTVAAFERPDEAELVLALRDNRGLEFSAVARLNGEVVAHVAFSPLTVGGAATDPPLLALAPVAVDPAHQKQGYGSALIRWALDQVRGRDYPGVVVVGEPAFYGRFGFTPASRFGLGCPYEIPGEYFMALELRGGALAGVAGVVGYRGEFAALT
jgi:putative acetyltransferase